MTETEVTWLVLAAWGIVLATAIWWTRWRAWWARSRAERVRLRAGRFEAVLHPEWAPPADLVAEVDQSLGRRYEIVLPHGEVWATCDDVDRAIWLLDDARRLCSIHDRWSDSSTPTD